MNKPAPNHGVSARLIRVFHNSSAVLKVEGEYENPARNMPNPSTQHGPLAMLYAESLLPESIESSPPHLGGGKKPEISRKSGGEFHMLGHLADPKLFMLGTT